jgi:outer membrane murein-binding lipoprotein Lpp
MFISSQEKKSIHDRLSELTTIIDKLTVEVVILSAKVKVLESKKPEATKPARKKKPMTAAQKAKQRQYQKAYNERKKAQKLLTKEANVSL